MSWFRSSPFASSEDAVAHMVALLAAHAEKAGTPLREGERKLLIEGATPPKIVGDESDEKFRQLIEQTFDHETDIDDPMSFSNSLQWAGADRYPRIVALAEEVIRSRSDRSPRLRGKRQVIDLIQLVGCAVVVVILMMVVVALAGWLFGHK